MSPEPSKYLLNVLQEGMSSEFRAETQRCAEQGVFPQRAVPDVPLYLPSWKIWKSL